MRKTMFAAKVFGLVIMFPLIAVLEINHIKPVVPENNISPGSAEQPSPKMAGMPEKSGIKSGYNIYGPAPESILPKSAY